MKWVRYECCGEIAFGLLTGTRINQVQGDPFAGYEHTDIFHDLDAVNLLVPVMPGTFYCVGMNYAAHIRSVAQRAGREPNLPTQPDVGYRAQSALIPHGQNVVIPTDASEKIHYEGELVVVIGQTARNLTPQNALSCVLGYTIGNDVSERTWQQSDRTLWRAKNSDTFKPMGPWIETDVDLAQMQTRVRLNGEITTEFATNSMIFGVESFLVAITRYITLMPGDVIWMGTDGHSPDLVAGDEVSIEITGIGTLRNTFVAQG